MKNLSLAKADKAEVKALYKDVDRIYISDTVNYSALKNNDSKCG